MINYDVVNQTHGLYCAKRGHDLRIISAVEINKKERKVPCICAVCLTEGWIQCDEREFKTLNYEMVSLDFSQCLR